MHNPIKYLKDQGFETRYISFAIDLLKKNTSHWKSPHQCIEEISNVLGEDHSGVFSDDISFFESKYTYFYVVQNLIIAERDGVVLDDHDLIKKSLTQARAFCVQHKMSLIEEARELGLDIRGEPKKRSGTKTQRALQIFTEEFEGKELTDAEGRASTMQRFQDELNMERSGALTYFHATKKRYTQAG